VYNLGIDVFYETNAVYVARQVVTNSKGEKVEVMWNSQVSEDLALLNVGFAPVMETVDYHWEIFVWGDSMIKVTGELDLGVPNTWFEYEQECTIVCSAVGTGDVCAVEDQMNLPEDIRPFPSPKHPNCSAELWRSQDAQQEYHEMQGSILPLTLDEAWYPGGTSQNIYNQPDYQSPKQQRSIT
jgi:hypothetical protein